MMKSIKSLTYPRMNNAATTVMTKTRKIPTRQRRKKRSLLALRSVSPTDLDSELLPFPESTKDGRLTVELDFKQAYLHKKIYTMITQLSK